MVAQAVMKCAGFAVSLIVLATGPMSVSGARLVDTPMAKVVGLLTKMKEKIESTGSSEQKSYDKYACWCEDTLSEKASDITSAKDRINELQTTITKNKGDLGSHGAEIGQLKKDIEKNVESQKEATEVRTKEANAYTEEKEETEQCIGALEAAIKVLTGAGSKKGFLETLQEAQLLSVVAGMRGVLKAPTVKQTVSDTDMQVVKHFVEKPEDFVNSPGQDVVSAVQIKKSPFGDYAPQSTQIQGILKSMYDSFTGDLEKANVDEAEKQKAFEELMDTKKKELDTLESSLESEQLSDAEKTKLVADSRSEMDDLKEQLEADEVFFTETKESCSEKASQWAMRSRLRTEELAGIAKAIEILDSEDAKKSFKGATETFLQLGSKRRQGAAPHAAERAQTFQKLRSLATKYKSVALAEIAAKLQTGGHFDKVIQMIDEMMVILREEEQEDIAHKDRCQDKDNANVNSIEDAKHMIEKHKAEIERLEGDKKEKMEDIKKVKGQMEETKKTQDEITKTRDEEKKDYLKAVKDDEDSIKVIEEAQAALAKFYENNKASFLQESAKPQPETNWQGGDYKGEEGSAGGVLQILEMLKEDLQKEVKVAGNNEMESQTKYEADFQALVDTFRAQLKTKIQMEVELADLKSRIADETDDKDAQEKNLDNEEELEKAIAQDCSWIKNGGFKKRRDARKAEMEGLQDAKDFLAGVGTEDDI